MGKIVDIESLFLVHGRELRVYLTRQLRDPQVAADLLQETFLRLAEQPVLAGIDNPRSYLYRMARNLAIDHFRQEDRRQTRPVPHESLAGIAADSPPLDDAADSRQRLAQLRAALDELPRRTRDIFLLNRVEGLTYAEVARRLAVSDSTVQKHLARALHHVMRRMRPQNLP
ncbi:MAG TPA: RNA polymerase sigma factor [Alphaproteobacteria bacterium]